MEYIHKGTGLAVSSAAELPSALYEPVAGKDGPKPAKKPATRRRAAKPKE